MDARPRALDITMSADASLNKKMVVLLDAGATIDGNFRLGDAFIFHFIMVPIQIYHLCLYMHAKQDGPQRRPYGALTLPRQSVRCLLQWPCSILYVVTRFSRWPQSAMLLLQTMPECLASKNPTYHPMLARACIKMDLSCLPPGAVRWEVPQTKPPPSERGWRARLTSRSTVSAAHPRKQICSTLPVQRKG